MIAEESNVLQYRKQQIIKYALCGTLEIVQVLSALEFHSNKVETNRYSIKEENNTIGY